MSMLFSVVNHDPPNVLSRFDPVEHPPRSAARLVRAQWRMPIGPVRSLTSWMEQAGCVIVEQDLGDVNGLSQWVDNFPMVLINDGLPPDRKRTTLAHELGHIVMHSFAGRPAGDAETEADMFANEFLMPSQVIRSELHRLCAGTLHGLRREWMVPTGSLIERARELGTISSKEQRVLAENGGEPEPLLCPPETPSIPAVLVRALRDLRYDEQQIAMFAGFADIEHATAALPLRQVRAAATYCAFLFDTLNEQVG